MPLSAQEQQELSGLQADPTLSPHLSPEEQAELHSLTGGGSWLDTKLHVPNVPFVPGTGTDYTPRGAIQTAANAVPIAGAMGGEALGTLVEPGGGTYAGAGIGGSLGGGAKYAIEKYLLGQDKAPDALGQAMREGGQQGVIGAATGQVAGPILNTAGKAIYNSGIKPMVEAGEKYGVNDVGQFLRDNNIWGRAKSIANDAWDLAEKKLGSRNATLEQAGEAGGVPSMANAVKPTEDYIAELRSTRDPLKGSAADEMEAQLAKYKKLDATPAYSKVEPQKVLSGLDHYFEPTYETKFAKTGDVPASRGVTPTEASGYKTSVSQQINPRYRAQNAPALTPEVVKLNKTLAGGLQQETEDSVSRALGPEAGSSLHSDNADLNKLLTMSPVADRMATLADRKNYVTQVDPIVFLHNPIMYAAKQAAKAAQATPVRTGLGTAMTKFGASPWSSLTGNVGAQYATEGAR